MDKLKKGCLSVFIAFILTIGLIFLWSLFIMLLWNSVVVAVFGMVTITYWQAFGLYIIVHIFLGFKINFNDKKE